MAGPSASVESAPATVQRRGSRRWLHVFGALAIMFGLGALLVRLASLDVKGWWAKRRAAKPRYAPVSYELAEEAVVESLSVEERAQLPASVSHAQIGGQLWDVWRARPVPHATLRLIDADSRELMRWSADASGRFVSPELPAGEHQVWVEAAGFARSVMAARVPHSGALSAMRVQLIAMPLKLRRTYQAWAVQASGAEVWGKQTPRELAATLRAAMAAETLHDEALERRLDQLELDGHSAPIDALDLVTRVVEEGYFGEREDADEALWRRLVTLLRQLDAMRPPPVEEEP